MSQILQAGQPLRGGRSQIFVPGSRYRLAVTADSPSLFWRFGEGTGTTAADTSGNAHTGTYGGSCTLGQAGALVRDTDTSVALDGSTGRITATYNPFVADTVRTFEGWANHTDTSAQHALFGNTGGSQALSIPSGTSDVVFDLPAGAATWSAAWPGSAQWVHWALIFDDPNNTAELFINGASQTVKAQTHIWDTATPLVAGAIASTTWAFKGSLDEFAVYEAGLSSARILAHYNAGI